MTSAPEDKPSAIERLTRPSAQTALLATVTGTFAVESRLWPDPEGSPMTTSAVARRRMVEGLYLEEVMEAPPDSEESFSRICYLDFNPLSRRWEYVSLDTRIPAQLMFELSNDETLAEDSTLVLHLPGFALPGWGEEMTGEMVRQRREVTLGDADRQLVRQYWTLPGAAEYLAAEYRYVRRT